MFETHTTTRLLWKVTNKKGVSRSELCWACSSINPVPIPLNQEYSYYAFCPSMPDGRYVHPPWTEYGSWAKRTSAGPQHTGELIAANAIDGRLAAGATCLVEREPLLLLLCLRLVPFLEDDEEPLVLRLSSVDSAPVVRRFSFTTLRVC